MTEHAPTSEEPPPSAEPQAAPPEPSGLPKGVTTATVLAAIRDLDKGNDSWTHGIIVLGVSLLLFSVTGLFQHSASDLVLLVVVLLIHELGHYLGMKAFNYQNVRMFFIPFFGAAVSGKNTSAAGWKRAVVVLMGPLPGIVIGVALKVFAVYHPAPLLDSTALMFLAINGFNLIPIYPLDGGRLFHDLLFVRSRYLEALFKGAAAAALLWFGWSIGDWVLLILGSFMALGVPLTFKLARMSLKAKADPHFAAPRKNETITAEDVRRLLPIMQREYPQSKTAKEYATFINSTWERMNIKVASIGATIGLLMIYFGTIAMLLTGGVIHTQSVLDNWSQAMYDGDDHLDAEQFDRATERYSAALELATNNLGRKHRRAGESHFWLATAQARQGHFAEAERSLRQALDIAETQKDREFQIDVLFDLADVLRHLNRPKEAKDAFGAATQLRNLDRK